MKKLLLLIFACMLLISATAQARKTKVACVGNSVTYGYGLADREHTAYPVRLQEMLGDGFDVRNFGRSSTTLLRRGHFPYVSVKEYTDALNFAADRVVIHLGLNDTDPRNWPNYRDDFAHDYYALIDSFRAANPKAKIWICLLTPIGDRHRRFLAGTRDWHAQIQQEIKRIARNAGVGLIDLNTPLYSRPELFADALHPNAEGAEIIARTVCSHLTGNFGGLRLPLVYSNNMVLQRRRPIEIGGTANAGERVVVTLTKARGRKADKAIATAREDGSWNVTLPAREAGGPFRLEISAQSRCLQYDNVMTGEVWLCSGQSNMAFTERQSATAKEDMAQAQAANAANLRLFNMRAQWETYAVEWPARVLDSLNRLQYFRPAEWTQCSDTEIGNFSAVAYSFGKMLADSLHVPVGLICNAVGGAPTEAWISRRTLEWRCPEILTSWTRNELIQDWVRGRALQNIKNATNPYQRHPYEPCYLFETGIAPLAGYTLGGVIWYQGESNAHNVELHERLFRLLVDDWRTALKDTSLPFYFVQLSSLSRPSWAWFRDSQRRLADSIARCGMAVSSDLGDSLDVHPVQKRPIGMRLARQALHHLYGFRTLTPQGPKPLRAVGRNGKVEISMQWGCGMHASDGKDIRTFEVCGDDGLFHAAQTAVSEGRITVWSDKVPHPVSVRYAWQPFTRANLVNGDGLPASTFRLDVEPQDAK